MDGHSDGYSIAIQYMLGVSFLSGSDAMNILMGHDLFDF